MTLPGDTLLKTPFEPTASDFRALQLALKSLPVGLDHQAGERLQLQAMQCLQRLDVEVKSISEPLHGGPGELWASPKGPTEGD